MNTIARTTAKSCAEHPDHEEGDAQAGADHEELAFRPVQAGLLDAQRERRLAGILLPELELLEALLHLVAPRFWGAPRRRRQSSGTGLWTRHHGLALLRLPLAGQDRIDENVGHAARRQHRE